MVLKRTRNLFIFLILFLPAGQGFNTPLDDCGECESGKKINFEIGAYFTVPYKTTDNKEEEMSASIPDSATVKIDCETKVDSAKNLLQTVDVEWEWEDQTTTTQTTLSTPETTEASEPSSERPIPTETTTNPTSETETSDPNTSPSIPTDSEPTTAAVTSGPITIPPLTTFKSPEKDSLRSVLEMAMIEDPYTTTTNNFDDSETHELIDGTTTVVAEIISTTTGTEPTDGITTVESSISTVTEDSFNSNSEMPLKTVTEMDRTDDSELPTGSTEIMETSTADSHSPPINSDIISTTEQSQISTNGFELVTNNLQSDREIRLLENDNDNNFIVSDFESHERHKRLAEPTKNQMKLLFKSSNGKFSVSEIKLKLFLDPKHFTNIQDPDMLPEINIVNLNLFSAPIKSTYVCEYKLLDMSINLDSFRTNFKLIITQVKLTAFNPTCDFPKEETKCSTKAADSGNNDVNVVAIVLGIILGVVIVAGLVLFVAKGHFASRAERERNNQHHTTTIISHS